MKIILHLNEVSRWDMAFGNIKNILNLEPNTILEILIHGEPLKRLTITNAKNLDIYDELKSLTDRGLKIALCNNTMKKFNLKSEDMCPFTTIVPAGVIELAKKQEEGFSYIKP